MPYIKKKESTANLHKTQIINLIRKRSPIYRAEIARICGLSIPTVMKITEEFISNNLVREIGLAKSTGGKPPVLLEFISTAKYIVGVDVGSTQIKAILMDLSANIIVTAQEQTDPARDYRTVLSQIVGLVQHVITHSGVAQNKLLGVGIGVAGLIDSSAGKIIFSPDFGWKNKRMQADLANDLQLPIVMDNVTRAMAMGELYFGAGQDIDNFLCVNLGYGIGASIVIDGKIHTGSSGSSGELGHVVVEKDGPLCSCGNRGCLEALASANAMATQAQLALRNNTSSILSVLSDNKIDTIDTKMLFEAYQMNDALATSIITQSINYLGIALGGILNFLDPKAVVLEGGVSKAGDALLIPLRESVQNHIMSEQAPLFTISPLRENAAAIGAASYLMERFLSNGCVD